MSNTTPELQSLAKRIRATRAALRDARAEQSVRDTAHAASRDAAKDVELPDLAPDTKRVDGA